MGWSENLFNLVRIGELSYPEAPGLTGTSPGYLARGAFHYNYRLHEAWVCPAIQMKMNLSEGKIL